MVSLIDQRLLRNERKALLDHPYMDERAVECALRCLDSLRFEPLNHELSHTFAWSQGTRLSMQDRMMAIPTENGFLAGVFDGHGIGGERVAQAISDYCKKDFEMQLRRHSGQIRETFIDTMHQIHEEVTAEQIEGGSTVALSFIDTTTSMVYTATVGDCEAYTYCNIDGEWHLIPLSPIRNWSHPTEERRILAAFSEEQSELRDRMLKVWETQHGRNRRVLISPYSMNVSRSVGDSPFVQDCFETYHIRLPLLQKPKVTVFPLLPGAVLLIGSDGIWDGVSLYRTEQMLKKYPIVDVALGRIVEEATENSEDNATLVAVMGS